MEKPYSPTPDMTIRPQVRARPVFDIYPPINRIITQNVTTHIMWCMHDKVRINIRNDMVGKHVYKLVSYPTIFDELN